MKMSSAGDGLLCLRFRADRFNEFDETDNSGDDDRGYCHPSLV